MRNKIIKNMTGFVKLALQAAVMGEIIIALSPKDVCLYTLSSHHNSDPQLRNNETYRNLSINYCLNKENHALWEDYEFRVFTAAALTLAIMLFFLKMIDKKMQSSSAHHFFKPTIIDETNHPNAGSLMKEVRLM